MATSEQIRHELLDRLGRAGHNGIAQSLFLRTVAFALTGTPEAEVKAALDALRRSGDVKLVDGRWRLARTDTAPPAGPAALAALSELRLSALAPGPIRLRVESPPEVDRATGDEAPIGSHAENPLDIDNLTLEQFRRGTGARQRALPTGEQVAACAWLVENAAAVARTIGDVFAEATEAPEGIRPKVATRSVLGEWEFVVAEVYIRVPSAGEAAGPARSHVVLSGACEWDEEHGFAIELSRGAVVTHGSLSCIPTP